MRKSAFTTLTALAGTTCPWWPSSPMKRTPLFSSGSRRRSPKKGSARHASSGRFVRAVAWQGADCENLQGILCHDRPGGVGEDRVRLLGHVETVFGGDPREVFSGL